MIEKIKQALSQLVEVQQQLLEMAVNKTELIKENRIKGLELLVREEAKAIQKLRVTEMVRVKEVKNFFETRNKPFLEPTMTDLIEEVEPKERGELLHLQQLLLDQILELKKVNDHNEELIQESMKFVHLSLDVLSPQLSDMQYQRKPQNGNGYENGEHSLFDSRA
ncbi:flagellar protein FlgN [Alkalihalobacillus sp. 1P02AB]|uniref:flagellar protein FlgN n=1 Tax=Alkalihalobacillus sp. 1P02AB TaxID=3132260 RepID=UPI0039A6A18C